MVVEAESQTVCQTGFEEEAELQWKQDKDAALAPCGEIKHVFARTARDCPEVTFLSLEVRMRSFQCLFRGVKAPRGTTLPNICSWVACTAGLLWGYCIVARGDSD